MLLSQQALIMAAVGLTALVCFLWFYLAYRSSRRVDTSGFNLPQSPKVISIQERLKQSAPK
jgi:hypothetical protein